MHEGRSIIVFRGIFSWQPLALPTDPAYLSAQGRKKTADPCYHTMLSGFDHTDGQEVQRFSCRSYDAILKQAEFRFVLLSDAHFADFACYGPAGNRRMTPALEAHALDDREKEYIRKTAGCV